MKKTILTLSVMFLLAYFHSVGKDMVIINSVNLHCNDTVLIFTPENLLNADTVPTLFLLHGWSGCYRDWSNKYDIQEISNRFGFRIICPDGFYNSWYADNSKPEEMQWRKFFDEELYPQMKEKYTLVPEATFISGLSMGGHGAINIFIDNPERFAAAGSMSGVLNLQDSGLKRTQMPYVFGAYSADNKRYDDESAINRIRKIANISKILVITCGSGDSFATSARDFCSKCEEYNVPYILILSPGTHSWQYWGFAIEEHLKIFSKIFKLRALVSDAKLRVYVS